MTNRFLLLLLLFLLSGIAFALEIGAASGYSSYRYLEVSNNLKEDLYNINSINMGVETKIKIPNMYLIGGLFFVKPHEILLEDLYGKDPYNYLNGMFYYGLNSKIGIMYPVIDGNFRLLLGATINFDLFYFRDTYLNVGREFYFSTLGNGVVLDCSYIFQNNLILGFNSAFNIGYLPMHKRGEEFKWSNSFIIGPYVAFRF